MRGTWGRRWAGVAVAALVAVVPVACGDDDLPTAKATTTVRDASTTTTTAGPGSTVAGDGTATTTTAPGAAAGGSTTTTVRSGTPGSGSATTKPTTPPPSTPPEPPAQVAGCSVGGEQVVRSAGVSVTPDGRVVMTWDVSRPLDAFDHAFLMDLAGRFQVASSSHDGVTSLQVLDRTTGAVALQPAEVFDDGETASADVAAAALPGIAAGATFTALATEGTTRVGCLAGTVTAGG